MREQQDRLLCARAASAAKPAARSREPIASAAFAVSPVVVTVLISTSSLYMS